MIDFFKTLMNGTQNDSSTYQNISPAQARDMMEGLGKDAYEVIDVRTEEEFSAGHVEGAKNMNLFDPYFSDKVSELDPSKTYFLICRSGNRSASACSVMAKQGHQQLYNIAGGMMSW